jgi:hypothetical protein
MQTACYLLAAELVLECFSCSGARRLTAEVVLLFESDVTVSLDTESGLPCLGMLNELPLLNCKKIQLSHNHRKLEVHREDLDREMKESGQKKSNI